MHVRPLTFGCARVKHAVGTIPAPMHSDDDVRNWFAGHVVPDTELWVAIDHAGGLVGILVLDGDWIDQLYVEPSMTGQGIGSQLLALARRQRPHGLRLWTFVSNVRAQRFYERHGFVEIDRHRRPRQRGRRARHPLLRYFRTRYSSSVAHSISRALMRSRSKDAVKASRIRP